MASCVIFFNFTKLKFDGAPRIYGQIHRFGGSDPGWSWEFGFGSISEYGALPNVSFVSFHRSNFRVTNTKQVRSKT